MPNLCSFPFCRTQVNNHNALIHMYYISIIKNLYINISKEKRKYESMGTTLTTSLKPAPTVTNLSYPRCFYMGTTWVRQPSTNLFFGSEFSYMPDILLFAFCGMSYPRLRSFKTQKTRYNG